MEAFSIHPSKKERTNMDQMPYSNNADLYNVQPQGEWSSTPPPPSYAGSAAPDSPAVYPAILPAYVQQPVQRNGSAVASLVLGIISMIAWLLPILGLPIAIVGVVLGHKARRLPVQQGMAITGLVLSYIALGLAVINAIAGTILALH
jgi:hypothetical protein